MKSSVLLMTLAASSLLLAQNQPPAGGWRRVGDRPPASAPVAQPGTQPGQDPEPVDRSDAYGQPIQQQQVDQQPPAAMPNRTVRPDDRQMDRPGYAMPTEVLLKPGTYVTVRINQPLSSDHNQPGDPFQASLAQPLVVDGLVIAHRGQTVYGRVAETQKAKSDHPSRLGLELVTLTLADGTQAQIRSQLVARQGGRTPVGAQVGTVATTTAVGAMVGAAADWGRGAAIGGGVGAAAGIVGVLLTRNHPTVVYPETPITFELTTPLAVNTARAPQAFRYADSEDYNHQQVTELRQRRPAPGYPAPYYYQPYGYPYYPYYGGPGVSIVWGSGPGYFYGRGYARRWR